MEALHQAPLIYPDSDGRPMSDHTAQYYWIVLLKENLEVCVSSFVGGDLLWYPVEGDPRTRAAPDVLVALGRPKGERGSYKQWEEGGTAPQVVFEVLSPGNTAREMNEKRRFYEAYGVSEYYVVDPDLDAPERAILEVWERKGERLRLADFDAAYTSPLLGVRFVRTDGKLTVYDPDGRPFLTTAQREAERAAIAAERDAVAAERDAVAAENARLRERLLALGLDPDAL